MKSLKYKACGSQRITSIRIPSSEIYIFYKQYSAKTAQHILEIIFKIALFIAR